MSYAPAIPLSGYAGWAYLKRTMAQQTKAFNSAPDVKSDEAYFRENIGKIKTAAQLVEDRRLLKVALGAFGLEKDLENKFFIQKVLQDGTLKTGTLAPHQRGQSLARGRHEAGSQTSTPISHEDRNLRNAAPIRVRPCSRRTRR